MIVLQGVPSQIANLVQDRTLERVFHDALFPRLVFRGEAVPELWLANIGDRHVFTRSGLMRPVIEALVPGQDPTPGEYPTEQYEAEASQLGNTIPTHMPSSYVSLASIFLRNTQNLGLNAAQSMDRKARNAIFRPYLEGEAMVTTGVTGGGQTQLSVSTLSGFTQLLQNGRLNPVSASNPLPITFSNGEVANTVVGFAPANPARPFGPGTITLGAALAGNVPARTAVKASTAARRLRIGAGATVDSISAANILTLNDIIQAVARLRSMSVPPHADGFYHVHLDPTAESQIFQDNHWQRLHQSGNGGEQYRDFVIGTAVGCMFFRNNEMPSESTISRTAIAIAGGAGGAKLADEVGAEIVNANGVAIRRTLVTGGGLLVEKYLDESKFITEAGVQGKIGEFSIINGGVAIMAQRIRYLLRAPQDKLQQIVDQTWSWSGDFVAPSDALSGDAARYKRAVVIEGA